MPIPLLAAAAAKAAAATAAKAVAVKAAAATAAKAGTAVAAGAAKAGAATAAKVAGAGVKGKLSIGMLQDPKVNVYPGSKIKAFAKKAGKYLESAGGKVKEIKWSEPTKADISTTNNQSNNTNDTYSKQIDKLESLRK
jgi:hypothetical protein